MNSALPILTTSSVHGEGAIWHARKQVLYWVDIIDKKVCVFNPATGENRRISVPSHAGTVVPRRGGGLLVALQNGFAHLNPDTGAVAMLAYVNENLQDKRFNDGKCDPGGRFWAGTMEYNFAPGAASLYRLDPDLSVHVMLDNVTISNGIVWTADRKTMYYIDTPTREVTAFDYDNEMGSIANRRTAFRIAEELGFPDGMTIDAEGMLWIALWFGGRVCRFDAKTGKVLDTVFTPGAKLSSSCAFGGADLTTLYITTSTENLTPRELGEQPHAGRLFHIPMEIKGIEASEWAG